MLKTVHILFLGFVACGLVAGLGGTAEGALFFGSMVNNAVNTFEDQDRESIVDIDGSGTISPGDVFFGWVRYDERSSPLPGTPLPDDDVYAVFSFQIAPGGIVTVPVGPVSLHSVTFLPTAVPGLTLDDLIGLPLGTNPTGISAIFEGVGANLITTSPGDVATSLLFGAGADGILDMFDFTETIAGGTLDAIAGFGAGAGAPPADHFFSSFVLPVLGDPILLPAGPILTTSTLAGGSIGTNSFHGGMTILFDASGGNLLPGMVPDSADGPPGSLHDVTIQNGQVSGAADLTYSSGIESPFGPFFRGTGIGGDLTPGLPVGAGGAPVPVWGVSSNSDLNVYPIPEPVSIVVWGLLGACVVILGSRRGRR